LPGFIGPIPSATLDKNNIELLKILEVDENTNTVKIGCQGYFEKIFAKYVSVQPFLVRPQG